MNYTNFERLLVAAYAEYLQLEKTERAGALAGAWRTRRLRSTGMRLSARSDTEGRIGLAEVESLLSEYLLRKHKVAEIAADCILC